MCAEHALVTGTKKARKIGCEVGMRATAKEEVECAICHCYLHLRLAFLWAIIWKLTDRVCLHLIQTNDMIAARWSVPAVLGDTSASSMQPTCASAHRQPGGSRGATQLPSCRPYWRTSGSVFPGVRHEKSSLSS